MTQYVVHVVLARPRGEARRLLTQCTNAGVAEEPTLIVGRLRCGLRPVHCSVAHTSVGTDIVSQCLITFLAAPSRRAAQHHAEPRRIRVSPDFHIFCHPPDSTGWVAAAPLQSARSR
ncbi:hypothetical protein J6590_003175 [Homalodisca vitripennis]|nr:hypothetical protein J6590_003175 [Homalodisca vitripennis]